jgi:hypothetical protein
MDALQRIARALPLLVPLALVAPMLTSPSVATAGVNDEEPTYDYGAKVTIEVRIGNGVVTKHRGEIRSFGNEWRFEFDGGDHHHAFVLNVEGEEPAKTLEVTLSYDRDGTPIIADFKDTYTARKRQAFQTEDGSVGIALTLTPTKFERDTTKRDDKEKLDPIGGDDPLGGNPLR